MLKRIIRLFSRQKTVKETLDEIEADLRKGWSHDDPIKTDAEGNVTHKCFGTAYARVRRANPKTWGLLTNVMGGLGIYVNKEPGMTADRLCGFIQQAREEAARKGL